MFNLSKEHVINEASKYRFINNNYEKVLRLCSVLKFISECEFSDKLALKGGTSINLWILDLPRLSVDADFDFCYACSREEMLIYREKIRNLIVSHMEEEGYILSDKSKHVHSLDSLVFKYSTLFGSTETLKIEINYSDRIQVLKTVKTDVKAKIYENVTINRLDDCEVIGSKINALLRRTVPRDVYDTYNIFSKLSLDETLIKKIAIFYLALSSEVPIDIEDIVNNAIIKIKDIFYNKLRETIIPLLKKDEKLNIEEMKNTVIEKIQEMFQLNESEKEFLKEYNEGRFNQKLLFEEYEVNDLSNHPMLLWKMNNNK